MTWKKELSMGFEGIKCRDRNLTYLQGKTIFDLGCGHDKVVPNAIGIDLYGSAANLKLDLASSQSMLMFNEGIADSVFSSHTLEHFTDTPGILKSWWRLVKPNGYLILYLPHKELYPHGENPEHKYDFMPGDIIKILDSFASYKLIKNETHSEDNEYSFEIVAQKIGSPIQVIIPEEEKMGGAKKKALVIRYGALGDMIIITSALKQLKQDGYEVHLITTPRLAPIENNPNIDFVYPQDRGVFKDEYFFEYIKDVMKGYDKAVNLGGSLEGGLLYEAIPNPEYFLPHEERHKKANVNYYDRTMELVGYPDIKGTRGELYLSESETLMTNVWKSKYKDFFKIMWQVRGSSEHKIYPYISDIVDEITGMFPNIKIFLVGGQETKVMDWNNPRVTNCLGKWNERQAIIMTSVMDLVVSPESGILNAAGCFDTPKIGLLTHSSKENLTKYFTNDYSIEAECECAPCHRLVHKARECKVGGDFGLPICMERGIPKEKVISQILKVYDLWLEKNR